MRPHASALLVVALASVGRADADSHFACNLGAFTPAERTAHAAQSRKLFAAVLEQRELPDGLAFRLPPAALATAAGWVDLERKCCPFFTFELAVARGEGPVWLRITGAEGVKAFLRDELSQLPAPPGR